MSLDADIKTMLDGLAAAAAAAAAEPTLEQGRADYRRQYSEMSKEPPPGTVETSLAIPGAHPEATMRIYKPAGLPHGAPLILYLHGGGFVLGDSDAYAKQSARIAAECGAVVAFLNYRLAPEHPFPAAVEDTFHAVDWLARNAAEIGADGSRMVLMGDSAGANLSLVTVMHHRPERRVRGACLLYPLVDARPYGGLAPLSASDEAFARGYYLELPETEYFMQAYLGDPSRTVDPRISPAVETDLSGLPPLLFYTAEHDILRDQARDFAERLRAAGNEVSYRCVDGMIHNFMQMTGISAAADAAFLDICRSVKALTDR